jgi:transcriptional regulatory protein RtcR
MKKTVVIGFIGTQLDSGISAARWEKWRPTVSLAQQPDVQIDRLVLFYDPRYQAITDQVTKDFKQQSSATQVVATHVTLKNPWDFGEVYSALYD